MAVVPTMRIVHVVRSDAFAGVERSILLSSRALVERGHDVVVIGGRSDMMAGPLNRLGVMWMPAASSLDVVRCLWQVGRSDIVHAHMTAAEAAAILMRRRSRGALVVTRHFALKRGSSAGGRLAAAAIEHVRHREIAISDFVASVVGGHPSVVHHGIGARPPAAPTARRVVVVQRLEREKNTDVVIRAWAQSGLAADGWELVIAGDGSERNALESLARELDVVSSVRFLGRVDDVDSLRAGAALQVATPEQEHFGLSVLEAMAAGLPVLAADGGAHRELLGEEQSALLFRSGDHRALAERLSTLAQDECSRTSIGEALRARQQKMFSLAAHGERLEAVYVEARSAASA